MTIIHHRQWQTSHRYSMKATKKAWSRTVRIPIWSIRKVSMSVTSIMRPVMRMGLCRPVPQAIMFTVTMWHSHLVTVFLTRLLTIATIAFLMMRQIISTMPRLPWLIPVKWLARKPYNFMCSLHIPLMMSRIKWKRHPYLWSALIRHRSWSRANLRNLRWS